MSTVPKSMPKKETEHLLSVLREVARIAKMKDSDFKDEIKEQTAGWRQAWIIEPIEGLIKRYEHVVKR